MGKREVNEQVARETEYGTPMDNLALDAMDARRAGMSYGKYKAMHPNTMAANEARLAETPPPKKPRRKKPPVYEVVCGYCGKTFYTANLQRKYCSDTCKSKLNGAKWRRSHGTKERTVKND